MKLPCPFAGFLAAAGLFAFGLTGGFDLIGSAALGLRGGGAMFRPLCYSWCLILLLVHPIRDGLRQRDHFIFD